MIDRIFRSSQPQQRLRSGRFGPLFDDFVQYLVERGHSIGTIRHYIYSVEHFDRWLRQTRRSTKGIREGVIQRFLTFHLPRCTCPPPICSKQRQARAALTHLLAVLRRDGMVPLAQPVDASPAGQLVEEYLVHLRKNYGAARHTCRYAARYAREFLYAVVGAGGAMDLTRINTFTVNRFLLERRHRWSPASMKLVASSLRGFFRFLQFSGRADERLIATVPTIPVWRLSSVPRGLEREQVETILSSFDRSTALGLRGYAITMCLAELGLRACEVVALHIDDVDWRASAIKIRTSKSHRVDILPMSARLARALLSYLRCGRPATDSRQIFVRTVTPVGSPASPGVVANTLRSACDRTGIDPKLAAPHAFRHTVATRLLRSGATIKDIADILRHRCIDTTAIYAKVDIETLRAVALPWAGRLS